MIDTALNEKKNKNDEDEDATVPARDAAREAINWLLLPASAGLIANSAVSALTITSPIAPLVVVGAIVASGIAKYISERSATEEKEGSSK